MTQYYIVEITIDANDNYEHNVYFAYDEDAKQAKLKGESKYHDLLSKAAISTYVSHSVIMFRADATPVDHKQYVHIPKTTNTEGE